MGTTVVYLGNRTAMELIPDPDGVAPPTRRQLPGKRCTAVTIPEGQPLLDTARDLTHPQGVWAAHSSGGTPAWVASTDAALAGVLAAHWGCELRDPDPEG